MRLSKTEVNLRRLLATSPNQQNRTKLIHYIAKSRELLEELAQEATSEGSPSNSKARLSEYSEKIEAIAFSLDAPLLPDIQVTHETFASTSVNEGSSETEIKDHMPSSPGLRRRRSLAPNFEDRTQDSIKDDPKVLVKLDATAQAHIEKHRKLQDNLTDEMVELAQQLKESSLMMSQSLKNTEKILDSTEKAVEQSLASTGRASTRAMEVYSKSFKTTCFTWLTIFAMTCIFISVVLLIRVT